MASVQVSDNPAEERYEARVDGELAGVVVYELKPGRVVFLHTEVQPAFEGHGIGSILAKDALDDVRSKGTKVVARCPFISRFIREHSDYQDLLAYRPR